MNTAGWRIPAASAPWNDSIAALSSPIFSNSIAWIAWAVAALRSPLRTYSARSARAISVASPSGPLPVADGLVRVACRQVNIRHAHVPLRGLLQAAQAFEHVGAFL